MIDQENRPDEEEKKHPEKTVKKTTKKPHGNKTMWCNKLIVLSVSNRSQFQLFFYFLKILIFIIIIFTIKRQFTKV